jgi:phage FluMu protein Com
MANVKFPCGSCQKLMAVGSEMVGRKVRCPHCGAINFAAEPATPAVPDEIQFNLPPREDEDSIFVEKKSESIFGSSDSSRAQRREEQGGGGFAFQEAGPNPAPPPPDAPSRAAASVVEHVTVRDENVRHKWTLAILIPYSVLMTVFAIVFYVRYRSTDADHPLSMIPDLDGEFRNTTEKSKARSEHRIRFDPDTKLYASMVTTLGRPLTVGAVEFTPLAIEQRPITAFALRKGQSDPVKESTRTDGLILRARIANVSNDTTLYPTDRYFQRRVSEKEKSYQQVVVGNRHIYGGVLPFPPTSELITREWVDGQDQDHKPLLPGQSRETVFAAPPRAAVAVSESKESCVWRVQLRRGFVPFRGKDYPTTAVVGVKFDPTEVVRESRGDGEKRKS